jgi:hypothetical protein
MIDTQQQYINLNIRGEISIIVVQVHSGRLTAGYPKALIPFHVPNNIPSTSTWPVCTRHK